MNIFKFITKPFRKPTADEFRAKQIENARLLALDHRASADFHEAMADMYERRVVRLVAGITEVTIKAGEPLPSIFEHLRNDIKTPSRNIFEQAPTEGR